MTRSGKEGRKTKRVVRTPATKFAYFTKRQKKGPEKGTAGGQKQSKHLK